MQLDDESLGDNLVVISAVSDIQLAKCDRWSSNNCCQEKASEESNENSLGPAGHCKRALLKTIVRPDGITIMFPPAGNSENKISRRKRMRSVLIIVRPINRTVFLLFKYNIIIFYLFNLTLLNNTVIF